mmetsp:Transcript_78361/g.253832  ORF Transcript_78361/g.253832 Transcript_78361/m.253832 type:complete len:312 (-) Transcript_78361:63-998(-)
MVQTVGLQHPPEVRPVVDPGAAGAHHGAVEEQEVEPLVEERQADAREEARAQVRPEGYPPELREGAGRQGSSLLVPAALGAGLSHRVGQGVPGDLQILDLAAEAVPLARGEGPQRGVLLGWEVPAAASVGQALRLRHQRAADGLPADVLQKLPMAAFFLCLLLHVLGWQVLLGQTAAEAVAVVQDCKDDRHQQRQHRDQRRRRVHTVHRAVVPDIGADPAAEFQPEVVKALGADIGRGALPAANDVARLADIRVVVGVGKLGIGRGATHCRGALEDATELRVGRHERAGLGAEAREVPHGRAVRLHRLVAS